MPPSIQLWAMMAVLVNFTFFCSDECGIYCLPVRVKALLM